MLIFCWKKNSSRIELIEYLAYLKKIAVKRVQRNKT